MWWATKARSSRFYTICSIMPSNFPTITLRSRSKQREKKNKLFVSVKDTGIGIPKDSLNLIFDRFYKTDLSRGKDKKGTGLGLSIAKEIIHSHGENINVISTEGVGYGIYLHDRPRRG